MQEQGCALLCSNPDLAAQQFLDHPVTAAYVVQLEGGKGRAAFELGAWMVQRCQKL